MDVLPRRTPPPPPVLRHYVLLTYVPGDNFLGREIKAALPEQWRSSIQKRIFNFVSVRYKSGLCGIERTSHRRSDHMILPHPFFPEYHYDNDYLTMF